MRSANASRAGGGMKSPTLAQALEAEAGPLEAVYVVRKCPKCPAIYTGSTSRGVSWRMRRHVHDGETQASSKLSGVLRRQWPFSLQWVVEIWSVSEIAAKTGAGRNLSLRQAEAAMTRRLHPELNTIDGQTPAPKPEQPTLWSLT